MGGEGFFVVEGDRGLFGAGGKGEGGREDKKQRCPADADKSRVQQGQGGCCGKRVALAYASVVVGGVNPLCISVLCVFLQVFIGIMLCCKNTKFF